MDRTTLSIETNREALVRLVSGLFVLIGLVPGGIVARLPSAVRSRVLHILRPAESALRRLVVVLVEMRKASGLALVLRSARALPVGGIPRGTGDRVPAFRLIDGYKRFEETSVHRFARKAPMVEPRIRSFDEDYVADPAPTLSPEPLPDGQTDAARLCRRLLALKEALDDLPKQAKRMARMMARRALNPPGPRRVGPMRPGLPPGYRQSQRDEIDWVLHNCHMLALRALNPPNTS